MILAIFLNFRGSNSLRDKHIKSLDGIRAISILIVLGRHFKIPCFVGGLGVSVFFFISGFLITTILLRKGTDFSIKHFYMRRILRLLPALYVFMIVSSIIYCIWFSKFNLNEIIAGLFYYYNYFLIYINKSVGLTYNFYLPLWSLSVEEHYYIFYPILLKILNKSKVSILKVFIVLNIIIFFWKLLLLYYLNADHNYLYYATDCKVDMIIFGCILAILTKEHNKLANVLDSKLLFYVSFFSIPAIYLLKNREFVDVVGTTFIGVCFIVIFYNLIFSNNLIKIKQLLENNIMCFIGKISYSLYLWHLFCIFICYNLIDNFFLKNLLALISCFSIASVSYLFVEKPFMNIKKKFI